MHIPRPRETPIRLDLTPLIDCIFLLLIFFLISSSFLTPSTPLRLPKAGAEGPATAANLVLTIDAQGRMFLNQEAVALDDLAARLEAAARADAGEPPLLTIRGDARLPYERFLRVVAELRHCGDMRVRLAHEGEE